MSQIKEELKNNKLIYSTYKYIKNCHKYNDKYRFINRSKGKSYLCIVVAGYKEFLYDTIFTRIINAANDDIDICVVSSGLFSDKLNNICEINNWSYLSTKRNNVALVQNIAIRLFPNAKYIFKLDEDIFITNGYFDHMIEAYNHLKNGKYICGFLAPLININGYGSYRILEKLNLLEYYSSRFERPYITSDNGTMFETSPEVAEFMWGGSKVVPTIDELNEKFYKEDKEEFACPIKFSIGAIMFERSFWEDMGMFEVTRGTGMGTDEAQLAEHCILSSKPIMVSDNVVVGHLSFGKQNAHMKEYYLSHKEHFELK